MVTRFLIACLVCFAVAGIVKAENAYGESIEWIIADSDRVVIGKVTKVEQSGDNEIVTIDVSQTIRGKHEEKIRCTLRASKSGGPWQKAGVSMLFCLKDNRTFPGQVSFCASARNTHRLFFLARPIWIQSTSSRGILAS